MEAEGIAPSAISAFESTFKSLVSGNTGLIPESTISPTPDLVAAESFTHEPDASLLSETVVLKLNGGLGTGMGLDKAKSLLTVKGNDTFLDLTAKQIIGMRKDFGMKVKFMLMNSFSTSADTMAFLEEKYPGLASEDGLEMMQNKVPKLDEKTFEVSNEDYCRTRTKTFSFCEKIQMVPTKLEIPDLNNCPPPTHTHTQFNSLLHARLTPPMSGAHLDTVIYMQPWKDLAVWTSS
jgi:hypothetical protein